MAWRNEFGIRPASEDRFRVHLVLIDMQKDFCMPEGTLFVAGRSGRGAVEDSDRIARFLYRNLGSITSVTCTLDTHYPFRSSRPPSGWTRLARRLQPGGRPDDVKNGRLRPNPALVWLMGATTGWSSVHPLLRAAGRASTASTSGRRTAWRGDGHALVGVIHEARLFHSYVRASPAENLVKGEEALTEYYSAIGPEVLTSFDGKPLAERNEAFLRILEENDAVLFAGQAASHCVKSTIEDLLEHTREELARKVYVLEDCMTSIAVPDPDRPGEFAFDFTPYTEEALQRFKDAGMHVVRSTTPIAEWPDFPR